MESQRIASSSSKFSVSGVYFAHVRVNGKLFRDSLETADRKTADRKLRDIRPIKRRIDQRAGEAH